MSFQEDIFESGMALVHLFDLGAQGRSRVTMGARSEGPRSAMVRRPLRTSVEATAGGSAERGALPE